MKSYIYPKIENQCQTYHGLLYLHVGHELTVLYFIQIMSKRYQYRIFLISVSGAYLISKL